MDGRINEKCEWYLEGGEKFFSQMPSGNCISNAEQKLP
jgi:hypothetical protein